VFPAGGDEKGDGRPAVSHDGGEQQAIHRTRHLDVREHHLDTGDRLQEHNRLVGVDRLDDLEAEIADHVDRIHTDQDFVLNDQNQLFGLIGLGHFYSGITLHNLPAAHSFQEPSLLPRVAFKRKGRSQVVMAIDIKAEVDAVQQIGAVPKILDVVGRITGMGFVAIARVTSERWICCAVRDNINFGLLEGGELRVETTICNEIRQHGDTVVINDVETDGVFCNHPTPAMYGFRSYISAPIILGDGTIWGTLCAIDPRPRELRDAGSGDVVCPIRWREQHDEKCQATRTGSSCRTSNGRSVVPPLHAGDGAVGIPRSCRSESWAATYTHECSRGQPQSPSPRLLWRSRGGCRGGRSCGLRCLSKGMRVLSKSTLLMKQAGGSLLSSNGVQLRRTSCPCAQIELR
jgi:GAF domain